MGVLKLIINRSKVVHWALSIVVIIAASTNVYADDARCRSIIEQLQTAGGWGGQQSMAQSMRYILLEPGVGVETVRCVYQGSGELRLTVDESLGAGIPPDVVKMGIARSLEFAPFKPREKSAFDTAGRSSFQVALGGGMGIKESELTLSATGDPISLSGGGGFGMTLAYGYGLTSNWDMDISFEYKQSFLSPEPRSVDGEFGRYIVLAALKYRVRLSDTSWVKMGLGGGYFMPDSFRCTGPFITDVEMEYDNAFGAQASVEYESVIGDKEGNKTFVIGIKYYDVDYDAVSGKSGGVAVPYASLPGSLQILNGNGADVFFGIAMYY